MIALMGFVEGDVELLLCSLILFKLRWRFFACGLGCHQVSHDLTEFNLQQDSSFADFWSLFWCVAHSINPSQLMLYMLGLSLFIMGKEKVVA